VLAVDHSPHHTAELDADDAVHLTALTGLTSLEVCAWRVGDVAAVALACHLSQLQQLRLIHCSLQSKASLPAIAKLVQLRHLDLSVNPVGSAGGCVTLLTQLSALTHLKLHGPTGQEYDEF
jgi:hypothetical protein